MTAPLSAVARKGEGGRTLVCAPAVGLWHPAAVLGAPVTPGARLGELVVLGRRVPVVAPATARGAVASIAGPAQTLRPVQYGDVLVELSIEIAAHVPGVAEASAGSAAELVFRAPSSGRFYLRPAPDKPPFVSAGAELATGDTVCLLEVMKTFNRIAYGGDGLPPRATVVRVVPADGDDLAAGDPILELAAP